MPEDITPNEETEQLHEIYPITDEEADSLSIARYIPQAERDSYDAESFAGPDRSFPITSQAQLEAAAHLIGHAANPDAVKAKAKAIAKRKGFTLPKAWQEEDTPKKAERAMPTEEEGLTATDRVSPLYFPITRASSNEHGDWIVEGQATSDVLDHYETVFDYESSKRAFARWRGNLREQHDRHKAVGKAIEWTPNDEKRCIVLRSRVSKGAPDTWQKILDGVLTGYSVSLNPKTVKVRYVQRNGKRVAEYYDFDYNEVSYVDAPGSPDCDIALVRADGFLTDVLDATEDVEAVIAAVPEQTPVASSESEPEAIERAGARLSAASRSSLHSMRDNAMSLCGCDDCNTMMGKANGNADGDGDDDMKERVERALAPAYMRLQAIAAQLIQSNTPPVQRAEPIETTFQRMLSEQTTPLMTELARMATSLDEVHAVQTAVRDQVDAIARQPVNGPVLNGAYPVDKRLATDPRQYSSAQPTQEAELAVLRRLQDAGALDTQDKQIAAAALAARRSNKGW